MRAVCPLSACLLLCAPLRSARCHAACSLPRLAAHPVALGCARSARCRCAPGCAPGSASVVLPSAAGCAALRSLRSLMRSTSRHRPSLPYPVYLPWLPRLVLVSGGRPRPRRRPCPYGQPCGWGTLPVGYSRLEVSGLGAGGAGWGCLLPFRQFVAGCRWGVVRISLGCRCSAVGMSLASRRRPLRGVPPGGLSVSTSAAARSRLSAPSSSPYPRLRSGVVLGAVWRAVAASRRLARPPSAPAPLVITSRL